MAYTRKNPSELYHELLEMYKQLHVGGEKKLGIKPENTFNGFSLLPQVDRIKRLIHLTESETILDYGSGKGQQYEKPAIDIGGGQVEFIIDYWDVESIDCFDPAYKPYSELPEGNFDGVICTDTLEHCSEEDVSWVIDEIFSFANLFVFASVNSYLAKKTLPNGANVHSTVKPLEWWQKIFISAAERSQIETWQVVFTKMEKGRFIETVFGGEK